MSVRNACARVGKEAIAFVAFAIVASSVSALAQPAQASRPLNSRLLVVTPAAAPVPALKYRLLPGATELNPGDAAPIYLSLRSFDGNKALEEAWPRIGEVSLKWKKSPVDKFPTTEARKFVELWTAQLKQIEFGTHRRSCDWNYTLYEQRLDRVNIALSERFLNATAVGPYACTQNAHRNRRRKLCRGDPNVGDRTGVRPACRQRAIRDQWTAWYRDCPRHAGTIRGANRPACRTKPLLGIDRAAASVH